VGTVRDGARLEGVANLVEIFSSVQGEGPHVGETTLFVRFGECDLRCRWCDSPHTWRPAASCRIETLRGAGRSETLPNPLPLERALAACDALGASEHRFASLTGGEPLLQPGAVRWLAHALRERGPRILLETHGLHAEALEHVVDQIDVVSMDWKLASDVRRADEPRSGAARPFHADHERFLRVARRAREVVVKVVVSSATSDEELDEMAARVAGVDREVLLVVQPVTPVASGGKVPPAERLLALVARLSRSLARVRLIPQTHKLLGAP
jgi:7-carboxy-7-deazaguanine synthase